ncbi:MAG TPA: hypothetical protein VH374_10860 [Polyangia bacterium]|jgi:hypothetical protein|nr:hypothetical protein [Polyangia bacterium]
MAHAAAHSRRSRNRLFTAFAVGAGGVLALVAAYAPVRSARADKPTEKPAAAAPSPTSCKAWGAKGQCCDPTIAAHLPRAAVYKACGESDATFLGEQGSKDTCKYVFRVEGQKEDETFVQVYAPAQKDVPEYPNDPFFDWKKVGKAFMTSKAKSPKAAPMLANATGLWLPGAGYFVSVNASTKVCTKAEAARLASSMK